MEDSEEFRWALKIVIKRQMRDLIEQLRESGEEVAIISADLSGGYCTHFGSPKGEWFITEQRNLMNNFLNFCQNKSNKNEESEKKRNKHEFAASSGTSKYMSPAVVLERVDGDYAGETLPFTSESAISTMRVWVPANLAAYITDIDLVIVFARLLATRLARQETGKSPMKTDTPKRTRSGRAVSSSFLSAVGALKKRSPGEMTDPKADVLGHLTEISQEVLKRFEFCTLTDETVDIQAVHYVSTDQLNTLTDAINRALDDFLSRNKLGSSDKPVKVIVAKCTLGSHVRIDIESTQPDLSYNISADNSNSDIDMEIADGDDYDDTFDETFDPDYQPKGKNKVGPIDFEAFLKESHNSAQKQGDVVATSIVPKKAMSLRIHEKLGKLKANSRKKKRTVHPLIECEHCGIQLHGPHNLKTHIDRVHLKIRNHKCPICPKSFWSRSCLETHSITVHTRKCYACQEYVVESVPWGEGVTAKTVREILCACGASVTLFSRVGLKKPERIKNENGDYEDEDDVEEDEDEAIKAQNKMFACGKCGRLYTSKSDCKKHAMVHSDVKNYVCDICGLRMKSRPGFHNHMAREHDILKNACKICGQNYNSAKALKVHIGRAHPKPQRDSVKSDSVKNSVNHNIKAEEDSNAPSTLDPGSVDTSSRTVLNANVETLL